MRFDWVNILATVIFVSIVVTLILAVASYFAYKVREARRPKTAAELRNEHPEIGVVVPPHTLFGDIYYHWANAAELRSEGESKVFFNEYKPQ